jgi:hypothetical protein
MTGGLRSGRDRKTCAPPWLVALGAAANRGSRAPPSAPSSSLGKDMLPEWRVVLANNSVAAVPVKHLPKLLTSARRLTWTWPVKGGCGTNARKVLPLDIDGPLGGPLPAARAFRLAPGQGGYCPPKLGARTASRRRGSHTECAARAPQFRQGAVTGFGWVA